MGSNWIATSSAYDPPWANIGSGFRGQAGHIQVIGGDLYMLAPTAQIAFDVDQQGWVWKSTDDGANWTRINATSLTSYLGLSQHLSSTMIADGTDLIFVTWHSSNSTMHAAKFSTTTNSWTANSSTSITTSGAYTTEVALDSATDGTTMYINHPFAVEKIMGTAYGRAAWRPLTISTLAWGLDTKWDDNGNEFDQTSGPIVVDANGDVHTVINNQTFSTDLWEHYEYTTSVQGPHTISGMYSGGYSVPVLAIETISSTETLIVIRNAATNSYRMTVFFSTNNGVTWSEEATLADYTSPQPEDPMDWRAVTVLKDSSDMLYLTWATRQTGGGDYVIWEWTRTSAGTWSTPAELVTQIAYNPRYPANAAWSDEPNGLYFYCVMCTQVSGSEQMLWGTPIGGAMTLQKSHTTDMAVVLEGTVADMIMPATANASGVTSDCLTAGTWGVDAFDAKTLVFRQWQSSDPHNEGYSYSPNGEGSWTFSTNIAAFDVDEYGGYVVIQLDNGELWVGSYEWYSAESTTSGVYKYNQWRLNQGRYTNGPHMKPRKIADAPAVLPDYWGVRIGRTWRYDQYTYALVVLANYEKVGGVNKVTWSWPTYDENWPDVWGDGDAITNPSTIGTHGFYHTPPQYIDPANTTYDERVVGIHRAWIRNDLGITTDYRTKLLWTREETSNTYVYAQYVWGPNIQQIWTSATSGGFTINYPSDTYNVESAVINYNDSAATVEATINAMSAIASASVTGSGTQLDPWEITIASVNPGAIVPEPFNMFYEGTTNTLSGGGGPYLTTGGDPTRIVEVKHQTVPNLSASLSPLDSGQSEARPKIDVLSYPESSPHLYLTDTDGKLSVMRPVSKELEGRSSNYGWYEKWQYVGRSISAGNVAHLDGTTQACGWRSSVKNFTGETGGAYHTVTAYMLYHHILYIDDTTKDIKVLSSGTLATYGDDGTGWPDT